jgi:hypothetical protein
MSEMAVVSMEGVGLVYDAAYRFPVTWVDFENVPLPSSTSENPVRKVAAAGLSPISPATHSSPKLHGKNAGLRRTNRGHGDSGHSCRGENCKTSGRAQVNGWRSGGIGAALQAKFVRCSDKE